MLPLAFSVSTITSFEGGGGDGGGEGGDSGGVGGGEGGGGGDEGDGGGGEGDTHPLQWRMSWSC